MTEYIYHIQAQEKPKTKSCGLDDNIPVNVYALRFEVSEGNKKEVILNKIQEFFNSSPDFSTMTFSVRCIGPKLPA